MTHQHRVAHKEVHAGQMIWADGKDREVTDANSVLGDDGTLFYTAAWRERMERKMGGRLP